MPKKLTCAVCAKQIYGGPTSLPQGQATCLTCRRAKPPMSIDTKRKRGRRYAAAARARQRAQVPLKPPHQWHCQICNVAVQGTTQRGVPGKYCTAHRPDQRDKGHRRRARRYGVTYQWISPFTIYKRDGWRCGICHKAVDPRHTYPHPMSASLDHVIPMSIGGNHEPANVQCSHLRCNILKSNRGGGEQLALV